MNPIFQKVIVAICSVTLLISCDAPKSNEKKSAKAESNHNLTVAKYSDGSVRAEIPLKNGKKHGVAKEYYQSGKIFREINYVDGLKQGLAKRYFENDQLAQETAYKDDKIHGTQKKYRENGKVSSVAEYFEDQPCAGLIEYFTDGKLKDNYPKILIKPEDRIGIDGLYIVHISLSAKASEVEYYIGNLTKEKYISPTAKKIWNTDKNGNAQIEYPVMPGTFIMDKIHLIAKIKTPLGNYYLTERDYNVAAENR